MQLSSDWVKSEKYVDEEMIMLVLDRPSVYDVIFSARCPTHVSTFMVILTSSTIFNIHVTFSIFKKKVKTVEFISTSSLPVEIHNFSIV